ncbi:MAG: PIG-L family deacetylase [Pseudonocardia sp.]
MTADSPPVPARAAGNGAGRLITPVAEWTAALRRHRPPRFDTAACRRVVVVAAHPDDETLGAGGVMRSLHRAGAVLTLVVATDGEAAYPTLDTIGRTDLARARRHELGAAMAMLGLADVAVHHLGLPDSALADHADALRLALEPFLADADAYLAPWPADPHPDHRAVGQAAAAAAPVSTHGWSYPIWMWAWCRPDDPAVRWDRAWIVQLDETTRATKRTAIGCFSSQVDRAPDGSPPVLSAEVLAHAVRNVELLFREPRTAAAPVGRFVELYAGGGDPWRTTSWYERRKRAVVLASLPREHYRSAFEPGCGTGELTVELSTRCEVVLASDPVADAVYRARAMSAGVAGARVERAGLPGAVPAGPIDLAVFSEVLYYLDDDAVHETLRRTVAALEPGGDVLVVHWRGWPAEAPRDAAATHRMLRDRPELEPLVEHVDECFMLLVLRRR